MRDRRPARASRNGGGRRIAPGWDAQGTERPLQGAGSLAGHPGHPCHCGDRGHERRPARVARRPRGGIHRTRGGREPDHGIFPRATRFGVRAHFERRPGAARYGDLQHPAAPAHRDARPARPARATRRSASRRTDRGAGRGAGTGGALRSARVGRPGRRNQPGRSRSCSVRAANGAAARRSGRLSHRSGAGWERGS